MRAAGQLVQEMCEETRAGWSWMVTLEEIDAPGWLVFHGSRGDRSGGGEGSLPDAEEPRRELWPAGGASRPVAALPIAANQDFRGDLRRLGQYRLEPFNGWLLMLGLVHALDEAARARPRVPVVGDALTAAGTPTLAAWASALTLADLQSALLRTHD